MNIVIAQSPCDSWAYHRRVAVYLETLQCRLEEGVSHWRTRQVTQLFTYLLTQHRTAATPTSVCLLLRHDSARRSRWPSTIAENLCWYVSCTERTVQQKNIELILTVKMETRHPVEGRLEVNFRRSVIIAELWRHEVARPGNFVSNFCIFWGKNDPLQ